MSLTVKANSGIMMDDGLDALRGTALMAVASSGLPEDVVYYLRALESAYLDMLFQRHKRSLTEIGWRHQTATESQ